MSLSCLHQNVGCISHNSTVIISSWHQDVAIITPIGWPGVLNRDKNLMWKLIKIKQKTLKII